jgi:hypothetical protein
MERDLDLEGLPVVMVVVKVIIVRGVEEVVYDFFYLKLRTH